jgi:hypothetical protein
MALERRKAKRRPILEAFSFFVVVPKKGMMKLMVADVSESGLGFNYDVGGENFTSFPVDKNETLDVNFYLNQTLYIPLKIKVMRIEDVAGVRRVGGEFMGTGLAPHRGLLAVLEMVDRIGDVVQFDRS